MDKKIILIVLAVIVSVAGIGVNASSMQQTIDSSSKISIPLPSSISQSGVVSTTAIPAN